VLVVPAVVVSSLSVFTDELLVMSSLLVVPEVVVRVVVVEPFSDVPVVPAVVFVVPVVDHVASLLFVFDDVLLLTVPVPAIDAVLSVVPLMLVPLVPLVPLTLVELLVLS
jgi:hypothetical protein